MKIGRIARTKQGRFALFDESDAFLFSVDGETLLKSGVAAGTELDAAALEALRAQSETRRARERALTLLSVRDHAAGELYEKLRRSFEEPDAAAAVAEMRRLGLLDDEKFARARARSLAQKNRSARAIRADLLAKGVDAQTAAQAAAGYAPDGVAACRALIEKSYRRKLEAGRRDLVAAALARRGFSWGDIRAALDEV